MQLVRMGAGAREASTKKAAAITARVAAATRGATACSIEHSARRVTVRIADVVVPAQAAGSKGVTRTVVCLPHQARLLTLL